MNIVVLGGGYVGLVNAAVLAEQGHRVRVVEPAPAKLRALQSGECPVYEPGLQEALLASASAIEYSGSVARETLSQTDMAMLCVGTPSREDGSANLDALFQAVKSLRGMRKESVVAVKSTVPPGTCERVEEALRLGRVGCPVVHLPEFLAQGSALENARNPARIVLGTHRGRGRELVRSLYAPRPVIEMGRREAELCKQACNAYLAVRLSFFNEMANLCESMGLDYRAVARGIGSDPRIGREYMRAGCGYGGSCLPKDSRALQREAACEGMRLELVDAAQRVNEAQKRRMLHMAHRYFRSLEGMRVAVLGLAFKAGTDDLRCAPSLEVISELLREGAEVAIWDRAAKYPRRQDGQWRQCATVEEALQDADVCMVFTPWEEIVKTPAAVYARRMRIPLVIDGRGCCDGHALREEGVVYESLGGGPD